HRSCKPILHEHAIDRGGTSCHAFSSVILDWLAGSPPIARRSAASMRLASPVWSGAPARQDERDPHIGYRPSSANFVGGPMRQTLADVVHRDDRGSANMRRGMLLSPA